MDPSLIDSSQSARDPQDRASDSVGIAREIYTAMVSLQMETLHKIRLLSTCVAYGRP